MTRQTERVLLVDDSEMWRTLVAELLLHSDKIEEVRAVASPSEALQALSVFGPTVIITDLVIDADSGAVDSGLAVCRIAREIVPDAVLLVVSGYITQEIAEVITIDFGGDIYDKALLAPNDLLKAIVKARMRRSGHIGPTP